MSEWGGKIVPRDQLIAPDCSISETSQIFLRRSDLWHLQTRIHHLHVHTKLRTSQFAKSHGLDGMVCRETLLYCVLYMYCGWDSVLGASFCACCEGLTVYFMGCCSIVRYGKEEHCSADYNCMPSSWAVSIFTHILHLWFLWGLFIFNICYFLVSLFFLDFLGANINNINWSPVSSFKNKDCLHWNILIVRRRYMRIFLECTLTLDSISMGDLQEVF